MPDVPGCVQILPGGVQKRWYEPLKTSILSMSRTAFTKERFMKFPVIWMALISAMMPLVPALADDVRVPAAMQRCAATEDCVMVPHTCASSCGTLPVNKAQLPAIENIYLKQCGKTAESNGTCVASQSFSPACINGRCTIGYLPTATAEDYKPGAFPVPEAPVPFQGDNDYSSVNDTDGNFSAYDITGATVRQNMLGQYNFPAP
ncbi:MAG: hypothetical protein J0L77_04615 [Alphaproteobacteria bacterium]|nr:hypothetical protein [Alphaproteobacteria bacterium]